MAISPSGTSGSTIRLVGLLDGTIKRNIAALGSKKDFGLVYTAPYINPLSCGYPEMVRSTTTFLDGESSVFCAANDAYRLVLNVIIRRMPILPHLFIPINHALFHVL